MKYFKEYFDVDNVFVFKCVFVKGVVDGKFE